MNLNRIRLAKSRISVIQSDGRYLPFIQSVFSLIISDSVFEHVDHYERGVSEIRRVLSKDGKCRIIQPVDNDPIFIAARRVAGGWMGDKIRSYFSSRRVIQTISKAFDINTVSYIPNSPIAGFFGFFNRTVPNGLEHIDHLYGLICKTAKIFYWEIIIEATPHKK